MTSGSRLGLRRRYAGAVADDMESIVKPAGWACRMGETPEYESSKARRQTADCVAQPNPRGPRLNIATSISPATVDHVE
jgi:hypothetical protein